MAKVVAELCTAYDLEPTERQVLQHGDVHRVYGIDQWGKWDVNHLPWRPGLSYEAVGHEFRKLVKNYLAGAEHSRDAIEVLVDGKKVGVGINVNGSTYIPARPVAQALGASVEWLQDEQQVRISSQPEGK